MADNPLHYEDALRAARHAVALNAGGTELILLKADLVALSEGEISASETLQSALDTNPENDELRAHIANLLRESGELELAEKLLNEATVQTSIIHVARARIQLMYADMQRDGTGETDEIHITIAKQSFETAIELNRELGIAWLGIARCERLLKNLEVAKEALDRASRLLDGESSVYAESALLALDVGDLVEANRLIESAAVGLEDTSLIAFL